jgi:CRISPR-associated protein Cmr3
MGGESKAAYYEAIGEEVNRMDDEIVRRVKDTRRFKLYLATPSLFERGWLPRFVDENSLKGEKGSLKFKLVAAAVGRYQPIGGWDLAKNQPKPICRFVPAGSVYFFELLDGNPEEIFEKFNWQAISDRDAEVGFGLTLVGGWDYV